MVQGPPVPQGESRHTDGRASDGAGPWFRKVTSIVLLQLLTLKSHRQKTMNNVVVTRSHAEVT